VYIETIRKDLLRNTFWMVCLLIIFSNGHSLFTTVRYNFFDEVFNGSCTQKKKSPCERIEFWCFFDSVREENNSIPIPSEVAKCAISNSSQSSPKTSIHQPFLFSFLYCRGFHNNVPAHYFGWNLTASFIFGTVIPICENDFG
jgi:hypothetical protein